MSTIQKNKELAQANQRAAERARKVAKKMQDTAIRKLAQKEAESKVAKESKK